VDDAISFLDRVIAREDVLRIVVPYFAQRCVFTVFRFPASRHRHTSLDVCILRVFASKNKVAFKFSYPSDACRISVSAGICEDDVFKDRTVVIQKGLTLLYSKWNLALLLVMPDHLHLIANIVSGAMGSSRPTGIAPDEFKNSNSELQLLSKTPLYDYNFDLQLRSLGSNE
jgi:hypothetical protein